MYFSVVQDVENNQKITADDVRNITTV